MIKNGYNELEWEIRESKSGLPTLLLGGRAVHSLYQPVKEADKLAGQLLEQVNREKATHLIIVGLGLGYLPAALFKAGYRDVIVWEPFPVMRESFPRCDGSWKDSITLVYDAESFREAAGSYIKPGSKPKIIIHPGYALFTRLEYRLALQFLDSVYKPDKPFIVSQRTFETLARLPCYPSINSFKDFYKDQTAILVNPGPSLNESLDFIKAANGVIFTSLQSAPALQKAGIHVNFMTNADPGPMTPFFKDCSDDFDVFFTDTCVDPETMDWWKEKTCLFNISSGQAHEKVWKNTRLPVMYDQTATISEIMLLMAAYMGFADIVCIGMDFCWKEDRYSYRKTKDYDEANEAEESYFKLYNNNNEVVTTYSVYFQAARYMQMKCSELATKGIHIYNSDGSLDFGKYRISDFHNKGGREPLFRIPELKPSVSVEAVLGFLKQIKQIPQNAVFDSPATGFNPKPELWPYLKELTGPKRAEYCKSCRESLRDV